MSSLIKYNYVLVGRPNVGKSSIFNFLVSHKEAYVKDEDGTTQDFRSKNVGSVKIWDSPGVFKINNLNLDIIDNIDCVFLVIENNILHQDKELYLNLKKKYDNVFVIINKTDLGVEDYSFFEDYLEISIKSRFNLQVLKSKILKKEKEKEKESDKKIWAIIGKPNVGKSTLINILAKKNLHKVNDEEGTTKEFLPIDLDENVLLDTPGQRKRALFPHYSNIFGIILIMDLKQEKQDLKLVNLAVKRKKPIFIIINKIDNDKDNLVKNIEQKINKYWDIDLFKISCIKGNHEKIQDLIQNQINKLEENYDKRIKTNELNKWLDEIKKIEPRIKFITQIKTSSPCFFVDFKLNKDKDVMLRRKLIRHFDLKGLPIDIKYKEDK